MSKKKGTTVNECCPKDCVFRCTFDSGTSFCNYIGITGHSRGCEVKDCDKMQRGTKKLKTWTNLAHSGDPSYTVEIDGEANTIKPQPKFKKKEPKIHGKATDYADVQRQKTLASIPKIKTTL